MHMPDIFGTGTLSAMDQADMQSRADLFTQLQKQIPGFENIPTPKALRDGRLKQPLKGVSRSNLFVQCINRDGVEQGLRTDEQSQLESSAIFNTPSTHQHLKGFDINLFPAPAETRGPTTNMTPSRNDNSLVVKQTNAKLQMSRPNVKKNSTNVQTTNQNVFEKKPNVSDFQNTSVIDSKVSVPIEQSEKQQQAVPVQGSSIPTISRQCPVSAAFNFNVHQPPPFLHPMPGQATQHPVPPMPASFPPPPPPPGVPAANAYPMYPGQFAGQTNNQLQQYPIQQQYPTYPQYRPYPPYPNYPQVPGTMPRYPGVYDRGIPPFEWPQEGTRVERSPQTRHSRYYSDESSSSFYDSYDSSFSSCDDDGSLSPTRGYSPHRHNRSRRKKRRSLSPQSFQSQPGRIRSRTPPSGETPSRYERSSAGNDSKYFREARSRSPRRGSSTYENDNTNLDGNITNTDARHRQQDRNRRDDAIIRNIERSDNRKPLYVTSSMENAHDSSERHVYDMRKENMSDSIGTNIHENSRGGRRDDWRNVDRGNDRSYIDTSKDWRDVDRGNDRRYVDRGKDGRDVNRGIDQCYVDRGNDRCYVDQSNDRSYGDRGNDRRDVDRGNDGRDANRGNDGRYIDGGNSRRDIDGGNSRRDVDRGNDGRDVDRGNDGRYIDGGNSRRDVDRGNDGRDIDGGYSRRYVDTGNDGRDVDRGNDGRYVDRGNDGRDVERINDGREVDRNYNVDRDNDRRTVNRDNDRTDNKRDIDRKSGRNVDRDSERRDMNIDNDRRDMNRGIGGKGVAARSYDKLDVEIGHKRKAVYRGNDRTNVSDRKDIRESNRKYGNRDIDRRDGNRDSNERSTDGKETSRDHDSRRDHDASKDHDSKRGRNDETSGKDKVVGRDDIADRHDMNRPGREHRSDRNMSKKNNCGENRSKQDFPHSSSKIQSRKQSTHRRTSPDKEYTDEQITSIIQDSKWAKDDSPDRSKPKSRWSKSDASNRGTKAPPTKTRKERYDDKQDTLHSEYESFLKGITDDNTHEGGFKHPLPHSKYKSEPSLKKPYTEPTSRSEIKRKSHFVDNFSAVPPPSAETVSKRSKTGQKSRRKDGGSLDRDASISHESKTDKDIIIHLSEGNRSVISKPTQPKHNILNLPSTESNSKNSKIYQALAADCERKNEPVSIKEPKSPHLGDDVNELIVNFIRTAFKSKGGVDIVAKKYRLPKNCIGLIPPKMTQEMWTILKKPIQLRDNTLQDVQRWLALGVIPIILQIDMFGKGEQQAKDVCRMTSDSITVLGYVCHNMSIKRRLLMRSALNKKYAILCRTNNDMSEYIFGKTLAQNLMEIRSGSYRVLMKPEEDNDDLEAPNYKPTFFAALAVPGPDVDANVANMINMACANNGDVDDLKEKFKIPSNCDPLIPSKINPEIWSLLSRSGIELDYCLQDVQLSVSESMVPLMRILETVYEKRYDPSEALGMLTDALAMLGNTIFQLNKVRMDAMLKSLPESIHGFSQWYWPGAEQVSGEKLQEELGTFDELDSSSRAVLIRGILQSQSRVTM